MWRARVLALAALLTGIVLAAAPGVPATAAPGDFAAGPVNVSNTVCTAEGEETVSSNPRNPRNIVVGSNQWQPPDCANLGNVGAGPSGTTTCAVFDSHDGGHTWHGQRLGQTGLGTQPNPIVGPLPVVGNFPSEFSDPGNLIAADQNTVWDAQGNAYYQCLYLGLGMVDPQVWVFKSTDGGHTWGNKVVAFDEVNTQIQIDRPWLAIDSSTGPRKGTIYLTYETMFYQAYLPEVYSETSTDGGKTWSAPHRVDDAAHAAQWDPRQFPVVGPDGALHVLYDASPLTSPCPCDPTTPALMMATSTDGGATFSRAVIDPAVHRVTGQDEAFIYFQELIAAFATSPVDPRRMVVAWPDNRSGEDRVIYRQSVDGGATWGAPADLADDPAGRGNSHDHPALAYLPDGRLVAVWRDRRYGGGSLTSPWDLFLRVGHPAGAGLQLGPALRLTSSTQPPTTGHHGSMPTEYLSVSADGAGVNAAWDQLSSDGLSTENYFRHVDTAVLGVTAAPVPAPPHGGGLPGTGAPTVAPALLLLLVGLAAALLPRPRRAAA